MCKMGEHRQTYRGYIAMLVVIKPYRGRGLGKYLGLYILLIEQSSGSDCDCSTAKAMHSLKFGCCCLC